MGINKSQVPNSDDHFSTHHEEESPSNGVQSTNVELNLKDSHCENDEEVETKLGNFLLRWILHARNFIMHAFYTCCNV